MTDLVICKQCKKEFEREVTDHTTISHLITYLKDTIESYEREDYHHGKSKFRDEIGEDIKKLEKQIKEERALLLTSLHTCKRCGNKFDRSKGLCGVCYKGMIEETKDLSETEGDCEAY